MSERVAFGRVVSLVTDKSESEDFSIGLEAIEPSTGRLVADPVTDYSGDGIGFKPDDVLFGKLRPYLGKAWLADRCGAAVGDFHVYRPSSRVAPSYLGWAVLARSFLDPVESSVFGAKMPRASWDFVRNVELWVPGVDEQRAIADYLDRETARIDTLIDEQQRLIDLLRERRVAAIASAVGGGRPLVPLVRCMLSQVDYRGATPRKTDVGVQLVTARNVRQGWIDYETSQEFVDPGEYESVMRRGFPEVGDILFTMEAPLGNVALVDRTDIALAQRVIKWSVNRVVADPAYLVYAIMDDSFQHQLRLRGTGSTAQGIKASKLPELQIPLPPLDVQGRIVEYLDEQTARIDELVAEAERFIELLRERRSALITAAVSGQIDVRTAA